MTAALTAPQRNALALVAGGGVFYRNGARPHPLRRQAVPPADVFQRLHERGLIADTGRTWEVSTLTWATVTPAGEKAAMRYDARLERHAVRDTRHLAAV